MCALTSSLVWPSRDPLYPWLPETPVSPVSWDLFAGRWRRGLGTRRRRRQSRWWWRCGDRLPGRPRGFDWACRRPKWAYPTRGYGRGRLARLYRWCWSLFHQAREHNAGARQSACQRSYLLDQRSCSPVCWVHPHPSRTRSMRWRRWRWRIGKMNPDRSREKRQWVYPWKWHRRRPTSNCGTGGRPLLAVVRIACKGCGLTFHHWCTLVLHDTGYLSCYISCWF